MSRLAVPVTAAPQASPAGKWVSRAVAALAGLSGAISYSHMRQPAAEHGQAGWRAHAFPLSVDGLELAPHVCAPGTPRRSGRPVQVRRTAIPSRVAGTKPLATGRVSVSVLRAERRTLSSGAS
jgi:hypothetical protein